MVFDNMANIVTALSISALYYLGGRYTCPVSKSNKVIKPTGVLKPPEYNLQYIFDSVLMSQFLVSIGNCPYLDNP